MTLNELSIGEKGIIKKLKLDKTTKRRFQDLGFISNTEIICLRCDTYRVRDSDYTIREETARQIEITLAP